MQVQTIQASVVTGTVACNIHYYGTHHQNGLRQGSFTILVHDEANPDAVQEAISPEFDHVSFLEVKAPYFLMQTSCGLVALLES